MRVDKKNAEPEAASLETMVWAVRGGEVRSPFPQAALGRVRSMCTLAHVPNVAEIVAEKIVLASGVEMP